VQQTRIFENEEADTRLTELGLSTEMFHLAHQAAEHARRNIRQHVPRNYRGQTAWAARY